ncbi:MAG: hypothetical protein NDI61_01675, partial [Bdellovibrionaceae bacterium]|nr:hypothetical protein [Pseudobdellovibrionaceae bacterium]
VEKREVAPFNPMVILKIVQGPQTGTEWELGYGPRAIGAKPLDLQLDEPGCPDICFELLPKRTGHIFRTAHPDQVKLNGRELSEEELASGDVIEINKTRIQILFSDESN